MARPIEPRTDYTREIRALTTLRRIVVADRVRGDRWKAEATERIDGLIRHLTEPPTANEMKRAA